MPKRTSYKKKGQAKSRSKSGSRKSRSRPVKRARSRKPTKRVSRTKSTRNKRVSFDPFSVNKKKAVRRSRSVTRPPRLMRPTGFANPSGSRNVSALPTERQALIYPESIDIVNKTFQKDVSIADQDRSMKSVAKSFISEAKHLGSTISKGIDWTANQADKIIDTLEPMVVAAGPEFAPVAGGLEVVKRFIDRTASTAERGKDAYASLTDTKKLQKMMASDEQKGVGLIHADFSDSGSTMSAMTTFD